MSSVGFSAADAKELENLRKAWRSLNALLQNIATAEACLQNHDLKLTASHLRVCEVECWRSEEGDQVCGCLVDQYAYRNLGE
jgi:hypothetical protein